MELKDWEEFKLVSAFSVLIILGVIAFFTFGGTQLASPAFQTFKTDISSFTTGITQQVKDIQAKNQAGKTGETVG